MSQTDYSIADQSGISFLADLNDTLAAIVSNNSGAIEPTTTFAYQFWADTTAGILKQRNAANSAWIAMLTLSGITSSDISNTPAGNISSTNVQAAINELDAAISTFATKTTVVTISDATWAFTSGVKSAVVTAIGGGGGAGGIDGQGAGTAASGKAGAGGGHSIKTIEVPAGTLNITIGAGGTGGASGANNGTAGGDTTVVGTGINITGGGGGLGTGVTGTSGNSFGAGIVGGAGSGGDINGKGVDSLPRSATGGTVTAGSNSGFNPLMGGGVSVAITGAGTSAAIAGEGGGCVAEKGTTANRVGGDGFRGEVHIVEYF